MRKLKEKLCSSRGASMIIAMVFMLICIFVGGSVLAAATANAFRLKNMSAQEEILAQQSTAVLAADALTPEAGTVMTLTISDRTQIIQQKILNDDGSIRGNGPFRKEEHITEYVVSGGKTLNGVQRILFESAIQKYKAAHPVGQEIISGFVYDNNMPNAAPDKHTKITDTNQFWNKDATGKTTLHFGGSLTAPDIAKFRNVDADFSLSDHYDCTIQFQPVEGIPNHMNIFLKAAEGNYSSPDVTILTKYKTPGAAGTLIDAEITTKESKTTSITWSDVKIMKGES